MKPIFLEPVLKHNIWGGTKLKTIFGYEAEGNDIGECWGIAAHKDGDCIVKNEEYSGRTLSHLWEEEPNLFGKTKKETGEKVFPLLIKIIDAKQDLSIQVHPDDFYAMEHENGSLGKTECWYILDCNEDSEIVFGHNAKDKNQLSEMIEHKNWEGLIHKIPVKKGDFIQINPGMIHAITGGIMLLETQQNSNITYRVYDYDRIGENGPRELHIKKSVDVIKTPSTIDDSLFFHVDDTETNKLQELYSCDYYTVNKLHINKQMKFEKKQAYLLCSVIEGFGTVDGYSIKKGEHFILPYGNAEILFTGDMEIMISEE